MTQEVLVEPVVVIGTWLSREDEVRETGQGRGATEKGVVPEIRERKRLM